MTDSRVFKNRGLELSFEREMPLHLEHQPKAVESANSNFYTMEHCGLKIGDEIQVGDAIWILTG